MKTYINIYLALLLALITTSCYQDKGSYDYQFDTLNTIDSILLSPTPVMTIGDNSELEFTQALTEGERTKRITVQLRQSLRHDNDFEPLIFNWIITKRADNKSRSIKDTINTKGYLDLNFPLNKDTTHNIMLEVIDPESQFARYAKIQVKTRPIYKNSLFFLHKKGDEAQLGNLELIGTEPSIFADAVARVSDEEKNPFANAYKMMYHSTLVTWPLHELNTLVFFNKDGSTLTYNPFGLKRNLNDYRDFVVPFRDDFTRFFAEKVDMVGDPSNQTDYYYLIGKDGRMLTARAYVSFKMPSDSSEDDYRIRAAAITSTHYVMWDGKNERFLYLSKDDGYGVWGPGQAYDAKLNQPIKDANVDFSELEEGLSPEGKTALLGYIQYRENYQTAHPFFIFQDENTGKYFLYELSPTDILSEENASAEHADEEAAFTITAKELENFNPSNHSTVLYNTWFTTNYIFYARGNQVIRYNTDNGDEVIIHSFPPGYEIACMKFRENNTFVYSADLGRYLSVGLNKGAEGAVSELRLTTSSDLDNTYPIVVYEEDDHGNRFGNIIDLQFVHEYKYEIPEQMR